MTREETIYVALLDEGVSVWRPVLAAWVGGDIYRISDQPYDRDAETWEFEPGAQVVCEWVRTFDGFVRAATRTAANA